MASELPNDAVLVARAQRGNLEAFNLLIRQYQDRMYDLAYRIVREPQTADDVTAHAVYQAYSSLHTFRGGSFRAWLFKIVHNRSLDALRHQKRRPTVGLDDLPGADSDDGPPLPDDAPNPERELERAELRQTIERCIDALPPDQRAVLVLSDVQDFSYQEIAAIRGAELGTVKSRLSRARAALRQCLGDLKELLTGSYRLHDSKED